MDKIFNKLNLTWKKLIIYAILIALYTALMALLPFTKDTSFRDIAIDFSWWILFGVIIISNSKNNKESALKCFIFFLISQPLVYLFQVPFSDKGFKLFYYYKYWFIWTLLTIPMGYIGYYIKKNNFLSVLILTPVLSILSIDAIIYLEEAMNSFPDHILSFILSISFIFIIVFNILKKRNLRIISLILVLLISIVYILLNKEEKDIRFENYTTLEQYNINLDENIEIINYTKEDYGKVSIINIENEETLKIEGIIGKEYEFTIKDLNNNKYTFNYIYNQEEGLLLNLE